MCHIGVSLRLRQWFKSYSSVLKAFAMLLVVGLFHAPSIADMGLTWDLGGFLSWDPVTLPLLCSFWSVPKQIRGDSDLYRFLNTRVKGSSFWVCLLWILPTLFDSQGPLFLSPKGRIYVRVLEVLHWCCTSQWLGPALGQDC